MKKFSLLKKGFCAVALVAMCSFGVFAQEKDAPKPPKNDGPQEFVGKLDTAKVKGNKLITLTVDKEVYVLTVGLPCPAPQAKAPKGNPPKDFNPDEKPTLDTKQAPENAPELNAENGNAPLEAKADAPKDAPLNPPPALDVKPISIKELNVLKGTTVKLLGSADKEGHVITVYGIFTSPSDDAK